MADSSAVILAEQLVKRRRRRVLMAGLDLEVRPGQVVALIGPADSGKTLLARMIMDLVRPTSGRLEVFGSSPRAGGAMLRQRIAYLPSRLALPQRTSVDRVIERFAALRYGGGAHQRAALDRAEDLLEAFGLEPARPVRELSDLDRQKLGLVLAFMPEAELLVLDEPTAGLDSHADQEFRIQLRAFRKRGGTVLVCASPQFDLDEVADRVVRLQDGALQDGGLTAPPAARPVARTVEIRFTEPVRAEEFARVDGVSDLQVTGARLRCTVTGSLDPLVRAASQHTVIDLLSQPPRPLVPALAPLGGGLPDDTLVLEPVRPGDPPVRAASGHPSDRLPPLPPLPKSELGMPWPQAGRGRRGSADGPGGAPREAGGVGVSVTPADPTADPFAPPPEPTSALAELMSRLREGLSLLRGRSARFEPPPLADVPPPPPPSPVGVVQPGSRPPGSGPPPAPPQPVPPSPAPPSSVPPSSAARPSTPARPGAGAEFPGAPGPAPRKGGPDAG